MSELSNQEIMDKIRQVVSHARSANDLDAKKSAAISTLCDRLVASDPSLVYFVEELRDISRTAARDAARAGQDDIPWIALA